jgi:membrane dipeptidase
MENADPIASPDELGWWVSQGLVAIGLSWAKASRYAGGNSVTTGLTDEGRVLVGEMDRLGVVIDVSHLSDASLDQVLTMTDSPVMASHSNCRALLDHANQRHLTDDVIIEIARRGGVIGLNLYGKFLAPPATPRGATIDDAIRHIERVCQLVGHRRSIGLGSDMDGGFAATGLPGGIQTPRDLSKLLEALASRGWSDEDLRSFACDNWLRFWGW